ncbi:uncharacterized protein PG998_010360 [Apiospora kogelbergensis]|uniref:uncharacterized protein n=1 Tax=Apiospora kogelbergensis TaxID=1337665 RepID=UPI00312E8E33
MYLQSASRLLSALAAVVFFLTTAQAAPHSSIHDANHFVPLNISQPITKRQDEPRPVKLRILSLGASIVWGQGSSSGNGFRKPLRDQLRYKGWDVNMVGSRSNGNMVDNNVEANPGDVISQVHERSRNSYQYKPNVVLINAGTNDANANNGRGLDLDNAGVRMESLIRDLWAAPDMSNSLIVLSTVLPTTTAGASSAQVINSQYRQLVQRLNGDGRPILLADMDFVSTDDLVDGVHPNDYGFVKMANIWWLAIERAASSRLIQEAVPIDTKGGNSCDKQFGSGVYAGSLTQKGSGIGDGIYYHDSQDKGIVLSITSDFDRNQWFFASLYGNGKDDLIGWFDHPDGSVHYGVWKNNGNHNDAAFLKIGDMSVSDNCVPRGVHFVDLNADGYDDFVCIGPDGTAYATINQRDGTATTPPTFKPIGMIKSSVGYAQDRVRMGDIDGDGRADYLVLDDGGNIRAWRNGWIDDIPKYWQELGVRFTAKGMGDGRGVRFHDLNGDVRHMGGMAGFATPTENYLRDRVHFARVYGEPQDFGLRSRRDYAFIQHTAAGNGKHRFDVRLWKNTGSGGAKLEADGNKYCNMRGYPDGRMDYVWTLSKGEMTLYPNLGKKQIAGDESFWGPSEVIWDPVKLIGRQLDRQDLHLTDWDGDGACDIVWADPDDNHRVQVWLNRYPATGSWDWIYDSNPAPPLSCSQRRGLGIHDLAVRFADISGNGRGDYLCIAKDGRTTAFIHQDDGSWQNANQIKFADPSGKDRANLRWADVNGDGKDDMIWVDKFDGNGYVWYNRGPGDPAELSGSSYRWDQITDPVYDGNVAGTCVFYPDLDGDGRADMHSVLGTWTNQAETFFNRCGIQDTEGDDGPLVDPKFPVPNIPRRDFITSYWSLGMTQRAMDAYMGEGSRKDADDTPRSPDGEPEFGKLQANLAKQYAIHFGTWYIEPPFNTPEAQRIINNMWHTAAGTVHHETMHFKGTVSDPWCSGGNEQYSPKIINKRAQHDRVMDNQINAQSWTAASLAMYMMDTWHLDEAPLPDQSAQEEDDDQGPPIDVEDDVHIDPGQINAADFIPMNYFGPTSRIPSAGR